MQKQEKIRGNHEERLSTMGSIAGKMGFIISYQWAKDMVATFYRFQNKRHINNICSNYKCCFYSRYRAMAG